MAPVAIPLATSLNQGQLSAVKRLRNAALWSSPPNETITEASRHLACGYGGCFQLPRCSKDCESCDLAILRNTERTQTSVCVWRKYSYLLHMYEQ